MSRRYAISGTDEAREYLDHEQLGARLLTCVDAVLELTARDAVAVLGSIDAVKLRSSMTLFELAAPHEPRFARVLDEWFAGERDASTLRLADR